MSTSHAIPVATVTVNVPTTSAPVTSAPVVPVSATPPPATLTTNNNGDVSIVQKPTSSGIPTSCSPPKENSPINIAPVPSAAAVISAAPVVVPVPVAAPAPVPLPGAVPVSGSVPVPAASQSIGVLPTPLVPTSQRASAQNPQTVAAPSSTQITATGSPRHARLPSPVASTAGGADTNAAIPRSTPTPTTTAAAPVLPYPSSSPVTPPDSANLNTKPDANGTDPSLQGNNHHSSLAQRTPSSPLTPGTASIPKTVTVKQGRSASDDRDRPEACRPSVALPGVIPSTNGKSVTAIVVNDHEKNRRDVVMRLCQSNSTENNQNNKNLLPVSPVSNPTSNPRCPQLDRSPETCSKQKMCNLDERDRGTHKIRDGISAMVMASSIISHSESEMDEISKQDEEGNNIKNIPTTTTTLTNITSNNNNNHDDSCTYNEDNRKKICRKRPRSAILGSYSDGGSSPAENDGDDHPNHRMEKNNNGNNTISDKTDRLVKKKSKTKPSVSSLSIPVPNPQEKAVQSSNDRDPVKTERVLKMKDSSSSSSDSNANSNSDSNADNDRAEPRRSCSRLNKANIEHINNRDDENIKVRSMDTMTTSTNGSVAGPGSSSGSRCASGSLIIGAAPVVIKSEEDNKQVVATDKIVQKPKEDVTLRTEAVAEAVADVDAEAKVDAAARDMDFDMDDMDMDDDDMRQTGSEPGSSGEEADIDSCSGGSGTGESASRRAHKLRAAVVCKDGHLPPQGQQYEGDCIVASRLVHLWTIVPVVVVANNTNLGRHSHTHLQDAHQGGAAAGVPTEARAQAGTGAAAALLGTSNAGGTTATPVIVPPQVGNNAAPQLQGLQSDQHMIAC